MLRVTAAATMLCGPVTAAAKLMGVAVQGGPNAVQAGRVHAKPEV